MYGFSDSLMLKTLILILTTKVKPIQYMDENHLGTLGIVSELLQSKIYFGLNN